MMKRSNIFILWTLCLVFCVAYVADANADAGEIFTTMAEKTGSFAQGFRRIALVLGAFGIIMFTFMAICGKINFKHLGYITICLFFLGGTAALIEYITTNDGRAELPTTFKNGDTYTRSANI